MSRASVLALLALGAAAAALPALAQDRYGPSEPAMAGPVASAPPPSGPAPLRGRTLSWPGKQAARITAPAYAPTGPTHAYVSPAYAPEADASQAYAPQAYAAQPGAERSYASRGYGASTYPTAISTPRSYAPSPFGARSYVAPAEASYAQRLYPGSTAARQPYARPVPVRQAYGDAPPAQGAQREASAPPSYATPSANADGWRPVFADTPSRASARPTSADAAPALAGAPGRPAELPPSIYTPASASEMTPAQRAAAAPPPLRSASAAQRYGYDPSQGHQVRFYSVHRPFGLQPDSAPIPPQFFTATADLSEPAGPLPTDRTTTTTTASGARVSHVAPDTSVN